MRSFVFYILILALSPMALAHAAPLCRNVFGSGSLAISPESIASSIKQIAELKLRIDLAQSKGEDSVLAMQVMKLQFPVKYQELVETLKNQLSEKEISELVKKEISRLQKKDGNSESEREHQDKKVQEAIEQIKPKSYKYELVESSIPGSDAKVTGSEYIYVPESKSILHFNLWDLLRYDLATRRDHTVAKAEAGALMKDNNSYLLLMGDSLAVYDIKSDKLGPAVKIQLPAGREIPPRIGNIILNPSETHAILVGYDQHMDVKPTSVIEIKTGKEILSHEDLSDRTVNISFLNDQQIAILTRDNELKIMDLATKKVVEVLSLKQFHSEPYSTPTPVLSNDGTVIAVSHIDGFISFNAKNITERLGENFIPQKTSRYTIKARGYPSAFIALDHAQKLSIFDMNTLNVEFDFAKQYEGPNKRPYKVAVSPDGEQIAVLYTDSGHSNRFIDIWTRKEN